jgi:hypothetical protein
VDGEERKDLTLGVGQFAGSPRLCGGAPTRVWLKRCRICSAVGRRAARSTRNWRQCRDPLAIHGAAQFALNKSLDEQDQEVEVEQGLDAAFVLEERRAISKTDLLWEKRFSMVGWSCPVLVEGMLSLF